jgi:O-antigen/teichoic acid export membrane protein
MLRRIFKMLVAQGANVGVILVTQLLLPPIFLYAYGIARYGEWLVLSATIAYLGTLNFGITTYTSNELTMLRQRGEHEQYQRLQASTLVMMLVLVGIGVVVSAIFAALPLTTPLHLTAVGRREASLTALFLGLQLAAHILGGYYNNLFMVVQETHRGMMWYNLRRLAATLIAVPLALLHYSFGAIAFAQFAATLIIALATIVDLRRRMKGPRLPLGLRGANWATVKATTKPSGMFGMIFMQNFLLFQVPIILLQRILGPEIVVLFATSRTVLAMARQVLSVLTNAIAPEITFSFGSGDMKKLLDIFHYSERVVFSMVPVANLGTLLFSPFMVVVWLHRPGLFDTWTYALMALISGVMSVREHKQFFQFSTNTHKGLANIVFWGNLLMIGVSIPMTMWLGIRGFMYTWLVSECAQMALLYFENRKLFSSDPSISMIPVLKLFGFMCLALPPSMWLVNFTRQHSRVDQVSLALAGTVVIFIASYWVFGLNLVQQRLLSRFLARRKANLAV